MSIATQPKVESKVQFKRPLQLEMPGFEIGPDDNVVDVGCGEGACCVYAGSKGAAVIGIDVEPILIERAGAAMQNVPARSWQGIVGDCDPIPLPDACATVVICTEVMEHVEDPARFAAELMRIGKPGARYLISVPDPASETLMRHVAPDWYWKYPFHQRIFEHRHLDDVLKNAGLKIERRDAGGVYFSFYWLLLMSQIKGPYESPQNPDTMRIWNEIWGALMSSSDAALIARGLERSLPKSQLVLATKPGGARMDRVRRQLLDPAVWKRRLRRGSVRLGEVRLTWHIHADKS